MEIGGEVCILKKKHSVKGIKKWPRMSRQVYGSGINPTVTAGEQRKVRKVRNGAPVSAWDSLSQLEKSKASIRNQALVLTVCKITTILR